MKQHYLTCSVLAILAVLVISTVDITAESSVLVSVRPGPHYMDKVKVGPFSMKVIPQMAIWIESSDGRFIDTVYVTQKSATAKWSAAGGARREEALPVWSHARGIAASDGFFMPDRKAPLPDAVSGATPTAAFSKTWKVPASLVRGRYLVRVELNSSFDWNAAYPEKLPKTDPRWSEVNGQPSLVLEGYLDIGGKAASVVLSPAGTGSLRGEDGKMRPGLDGLTTALELVASIEAEYRP